MSSSVKLLSQYWARVPFLILYYGIGQYLPVSYSKMGGESLSVSGISAASIYLTIAERM